MHSFVYAVMLLLLPLLLGAGTARNGHRNVRAEPSLSWSSVQRGAMIGHGVSAHGRIISTYTRVLSPPSASGAAIGCTDGSRCTPLRHCRDPRAPYPEPVCGADFGDGPSICCVDERTSARSLDATAECGIPVKKRTGTNRKINRTPPTGSRIREKPTPHVFGGREVEKTDIFPFMAGIYLKIGKNEIFLCGATLISRTTLLTAAHCFLDMRESDDYVVRVGSVVRHRPVPKVAAKSSTLPVLSVLLHPDFRHPRLYHDIALIGIAAIRHFSDSVRPICLPLAPTKVSEGGGVTLIVIGWGAQEFGGGTSATLQEAEVPIVNRRSCEEAYARIHSLRVSYPDGITNRLLCAGNVNQSRDACQGDSGGPLVRLDRHRRWRQEGIVSAGAGCGTPGVPGVYTRVVHYLDWIESNAF